MWDELNNMQFASIILNLTVVFLSLFLIIFFSFRSKRNGTFFSFIIVQAAIFIWSSGLIFEAFTKPGTSMSWIILYYYYLGICFIGTSWLVFSLYYTDNPISNRKLLIAFMYTPPAIFYFSVITNHFHYLFYRVKDSERYYGPIFTAHMIYSYSCIVIAMILLIRYTVKNNSFKRNQIIIVIISCVIPFLTNAGFIIFDIKIKITSFSFIISLLLFTFATYKMKFMNIVPVSLLRYVNFMSEALIVVDRNGQIENYNISFQQTFKYLIDLKAFSNIMDFTNVLKEKLLKRENGIDIMQSIEFGTKERITGEICICINQNSNYFFVTVQPVISKKGNIIGRVISFSNVDEYKKMLENLNEKNIELSVMNDQLIEYSSKVEQLSVIKERNRIAKDVHDSVGHTMTVLISLLGVCKMQINKDTGSVASKLEDAIKISRDGLAEIRRSLKGFSVLDAESSNFIGSIENLVNSFKNTGVDVDFLVDGRADNLGTDIRYALYRACQEAMTNSLRHGKATSISVILFFNSVLAKLFIIDNGYGCKSVKPGMGLIGMEERIKELNGTIAYGPNGDNGFNIHIEIPLDK